MDYSKMSDKEINREVQKLTGMGCMSGDGVLIVADGRWRRFDPCNNPADAWQVIVENGIGIKKQSNGMWCATRQGVTNGAKLIHPSG